MWWLLTWAAYLSAAGLAVGAAGYYAVVHLAVLQRLLAGAAERWLRQITASEDGAPAVGFSVWHTDNGAPAAPASTCYPFPRLH